MTARGFLHRRAAWAGAAAVCAVLAGVSGARAAGAAKPVKWLPYEVVRTAGPAAWLDIHADGPAAAQVSRLLFGKFTEHLGANVYGGMWAQILNNPGFEGVEKFTGTARGGHGRTMAARLARLERSMGVSGLTEALKMGVAPCWAAYGEGATRATEAGAYNSDRCQRIGPGGVPAGIQQPIYLPLHRVRTFELTFAARARGAARLAVSIRKGLKADREVARPVAVGGLGLAWRKFTAKLKVADAHATVGDVYWLRIAATGGGTVWLDQVLLFPTDHVDGFDPDVVRYWKQAHLPLLRFPGGNFASGYHWADGVGPPDKRPTLPNLAWNTIEYNHVGTDEMMAFCRAVGCEPMICVNAGSGTPAEAARWVEYCNGSAATRFGAMRAANGHPKPYNVRYWEIGNELYGNWQIGSCDAATYAERYKAFRTAMLKADPSIRLIANGHTPTWNAAVVRGNPGAVRSLSVHTLLGGAARGERDAAKVFRAMMGFTHTYPRLLRWNAAPLAKAGQDPRVAITELQLFTGDHHLPNNSTLAEALWTAGIINVAIRSGGAVELITHSALVNHGGGLRKIAQFVWPEPVYFTHGLYGSVGGVRPLRAKYTGPCLDAAGVRGVPGSKGAPLLDAMPLGGVDGGAITLIVVNRSAELGIRTKVALHGFRPGGTVKVWSLAAPSFMADNSIHRPDAVRPAESTLAAAGDGVEYEFPMHSLTALTFRRR